MLCWRSVLLHRSIAMLTLHFLRGWFRFAGFVMAEVSDIPLYTACTWAFLCNRTKLVTKLCVAMNGRIYWEQVLPNRMSYAAHIQSELACSQRLAHTRIYTQNPFFGSQCSTYGSATIHTSCRNAPRGQHSFQNGTQSYHVAGLTVVHFAPLLRALACACARRRGGLLRHCIVPFTGSILFHGIGAYVSRVSIGLRHALLSMLTSKVSCGRPRLSDAV